MTKEEHIEEIMNWFDFNRVHRAMDALGWSWFYTEGTPSVKQLRECAEDLLSQTYDKGKSIPGDYGIATGGFHAWYNYEYDQLELKFVVSSWETNEV